MNSHHALSRRSALVCLFLVVALGLWAANSSYERSFSTLDRDGSVAIKTDSVDITIQQNSLSDKLEVTLSGSGRNRYNLTVHEDGGDFSIEVRRKKQWLIRIFQKTEAALDVTLPASWKNGDLEIGSVSGSIRLDAALVASEIDLETVSGSIRFSDLMASDDVQMKSVSGTISGDTAEAPSMEINTVSGTIGLDRLEITDDGTADISSISGSIHLAQTKADTLAVRTISGSIFCTIDDAFDGILKVRTTSGNINSRISGASGEETDNRTHSYTLGKGPGLIEIVSTSGSLSIKQ
ncbi:MAG: DUF4097 family beta strand repeat-containing protein [Sphaerochaetaceae bacterium]